MDVQGRVPDTITKWAHRLQREQYELCTDGVTDKEVRDQCLISPATESIYYLFSQITFIYRYLSSTFCLTVAFTYYSH